MGTSNLDDKMASADLHFDYPADDLSVIDLRFVQRMVMRALQVLHAREKWERLVDLALRLNALTG